MWKLGETLEIVVQTIHFTGEKNKGDRRPLRQLGGEVSHATVPASR